MKKLRIKSAKAVRGSVQVPPDKSISHRAAIFAAMANGESEIRNYLFGEDCLSTLNALKSLGAIIRRRGKNVYITGGKLKSPARDVYCGNSGTTMRLLCGMIAGMNMSAKLVGDRSLSKRPMERITSPLTAMGARIKSRRGFPPLFVRGSSDLRAIKYIMPIASAQVKTSIMLAALNASGETMLKEKIPSRDHTARMLPFFGARFKKKGDFLAIEGGGKLKPAKISVPGDFSSAAFFITAAVMLQSVLTIKNVGLNPTRTGFLKALGKMGLKYRIKNRRYSYGEPSGDITVLKSVLRGMDFSADDIPAMIDEVPLLALVATKARGISLITGAEELRVKECDRIEGVFSQLKKMGADIEKLPGGFRIKGPTPLRGASVTGFGDHRIVMMLSLAALAVRSATGVTVIDDVSCVKISFPGFFRTLKKILVGKWGRP